MISKLIRYIKLNRLEFNYIAKHKYGFILNKKLQFPARLSTLYNHLLNYLGVTNIFSVDELGIIKSYKTLELTELNVLVVGAGEAISLIYNSLYNPNFHLTVVEANSDQIEIAKDNLKLNNVTKKVNFIHAFVGEKYLVYGDQDKNSEHELDINNLDIGLIELDCEGSEIEIISSLKIMPAYIIVEIHPMYNNVSFDDLMNLIDKKKYKILSAFTVNGKEIPIHKLSFYFSRKVVDSLRKKPNGDLMVVLTLKKIKF